MILVILILQALIVVVVCFAHVAQVDKCIFRTGIPRCASKHKDHRHTYLPTVLKGIELLGRVTDNVGVCGPPITY